MPAASMPALDAGSNATAAVATSLNALLADTFVLYLKTKNFHWHVSGPHFRDYHLLLDDQAVQVLARADEIAERVRKLGAPTLRSIGDIKRHQRLADNDAEALDARGMLEALRDDNLALIASLRELKGLADVAGDNATSGLVDAWTDNAEQRAWFLREALAARPDDLGESSVEIERPRPARRS